MDFWTLLVLAVVGIIVVLVRRNHHHDQHDEASQSASGPGSAPSNWDEVRNLSGYGPAQLKAFVSPMLDISQNCYTYPQASSVTGWSVSSRVAPLLPSGAGVQALLYEEQNGARLILGFKGTTSQADSCVDGNLFGSIPGMPLPSEDTCISSYTNRSLDYVSQALNYTNQVLQAFPGRPLLLTGHSLGAGLAVIVSAALSTTQPSAAAAAVCFNSPGAGKAIKSRGFAASPAARERIVILGDEWDMVMKTFWEEQVGTVCVFRHAQPADCAACSSSGARCTSCSFQTHLLNLVLQFLDSGVKPSCSLL